MEREGEVAPKCPLCRCPAVVLLKVVQSSFFRKLSSCYFFGNCPVVVDQSNWRKPLEYKKQIQVLKVNIRNIL